MACKYPLTWSIFPASGLHFINRLDVLNAKFQTALNITAAKAGVSSDSHSGILDSGTDRPRIGPARCLLRSLFHRAPDLLWVDREEVRLQMDIHRRPVHIRRWRSDVLAFSCVPVFWRLLRFPLHRRLWTLDSRDLGEPVHCDLRAAPSVGVPSRALTVVSGHWLCQYVLAILFHHSTSNLVGDLRPQAPSDFAMGINELQWLPC